MITIHQAICPPGAVPQGRHLHFTEDAPLHNDSKNTWDACRRLPDPNLTFTMKTMANTAAKNSSRGTGSTPLGSTLRGLKKPGPGKWMKMGWYQPYIYIHCIYTLVGGLNPSEKYESQLGLLFQYMEK
jgi:hypothetical protein